MINGLQGLLEALGPALPKTGGLGALLAHHEQSETTQDDGGNWINIYGQATPQAGQRLPLLHEYEATTYPDEPNATAAAILCSNMEGGRNEFLGGNLPGRRPR